jgi:GTP-binding protein HflX
LFERPHSGERAVLVHVTLGETVQAVDDLAEFQELASSANVQSVQLVTGTCRHPDPRLFVGTGKAEEIRQAVQNGHVHVVIINQDISPSQERNLEKFLECRVVGRTGLILDIFAQRARSFEGKLQVELAQLRHLSTRLIRGWTHLERQKGGIGLRGPGETQLETDRRLIAERIKRIKQRLQKVERQRHQGRQARRKAEVHTVSLVGYTNAGKSTLFNGLTNAHAQTADQLFATLDPTLRQLSQTAANPIVMADTVGFISQLPHELIAAFRATLQESCEATLLLHVIDLSDPYHPIYREQVYQVLSAIGADHVPFIEVFNKIDCLDTDPRVEEDETGQIRAVWVSAQTGAGLELLREAIVKCVYGEMVHSWVCLPPEAGRLRARLFSLNAVVTERLTGQGNWLLELRLASTTLERLHQQDGLRREWIDSKACEGLLQ